MYRDHTIGVVVPAYNEEGFVGEVIETMPEFVDYVYVVDDCSTDDTWHEIQVHAARRNRELAKSNGDGSSVTADGGQSLEPRVVPIRHEENRGVGGAIKTGYLRALEGDADIVVVMGGDGQMDPDILPRFLDPIVEDEADYTKGNRLLNAEYRADMPTVRLIGNSILTVLTKVASGYWKMMDSQNGYTAISRQALANVGIESMYEYYGYCNDLLVKLNANEMRVADVVIPAIYGDEESNIEYPRYIPKVSWMLFRNFCWRLRVKYLVRDFHPLALFYVVGALTSAVGALGGLWSAYTARTSEDSAFVRSALSFLAFVAGTLFVLFAMLFDRRANEGKELRIHEERGGREP